MSRYELALGKTFVSVVFVEVQAFFVVSVSLMANAANGKRFGFSVASRQPEFLLCPHDATLGYWACAKPSKDGTYLLQGL